MIFLNEVLAIHDILIERFGGARGVRDQGARESAINRPIRHLTERNFIQLPQTKPLQALKA